VDYRAGGHWWNLQGGLMAASVFQRHRILFDHYPPRENTLLQLICWRRPGDVHARGFAYDQLGTGYGDYVLRPRSVGPCACAVGWDKTVLVLGIVGWSTHTMKPVGPHSRRHFAAKQDRPFWMRLGFGPRLMADELEFFFVSKGGLTAPLARRGNRQPCSCR